MATAKLFQNGRSQAVRLPKEYRFEGDEVSIRREGEGVVLEPVKRRSWPRGYWRSWSKTTRALEAAAAFRTGGRSTDLDDE